LGVPFYLCVHPLSQNYKIGRGNTRGKGRVSWCQSRFPSQESGVLGLSNFGVILYLCLHSLTQNDQIQHGNTYGESMFSGGQPRRCIYTDAARGLSVTAEFLDNELRCL